METKFCIGFISRSASTMKIFIKFYQYKLVSAKIITNADPYSEPWWASEMKSFVKIVNGFRLFTTFVSSMLDVSQGSEYFCGMSLLTNIFLELSKFLRATTTVSAPIFLLEERGATFSIENGGSEKKWMSGGLKSSWHRCLPGGLPCFLSKRDFVK